MSEKKYLVDGDPTTARELIQAAEDRDEDFAKGWLKQTSRAAEILRTRGHAVEENPEYK